MKLYLDIFFVFFKLSLISLGGVFGVLPELERDVVTNYQWMTHEQFIQTYVVGQVVPGPTMAMCPLIGFLVGGWPGWIAGFLGIYSGPMIIMALAFSLYSKYRNIQWVRRSEIALRPLIFGLLAASCIHLWWIQSSPSRLFSLILTGIGTWIYMKKWLGPITLVFAVGFVWWSFFQIGQ